MNNAIVNFQNPLQHIGVETEGTMPDGGFGAVLARSGVGKTSFLVQMALYSMLRQKHALHISFEDPVDKICVWYKEMFQQIARAYQIAQPRQLWETVLPCRFIMTFRVDRFSVKRLTERMHELSAQDIFVPQQMFIDGFPFDDTAHNSLDELKQLAREKSINIWFTVRTHRDEPGGSAAIPPYLETSIDLFDMIFLLEPDGKDIFVKPLKGGTSEQPQLVMDPASMFIRAMAG